MSRISLALRWLFVGLCIFALAMGMSAYLMADLQLANERRLGGHLLAMALGFPTAFFGAGFLSDVARYFGVQTFDVAAEPFLYFRDWLFVVVLGYVQWFVVLPTIWRFLGLAMRTTRNVVANSKKR